MKTDKNQLEVVRREFSEWRAAKEFASQPIPERLWHSAVDLLNRYSLPRVAVALKVPIKNLQRQEALRNHEQSPASESSAKIDEAATLSGIHVTRIDLPSMYHPKPLNRLELLLDSITGASFQKWVIMVDSRRRDHS